MTKKRYYILDSPHTMPFICDRLDNDKTIAEVHSDNVERLCDLLNEQDNGIQRIYSTLDNRMDKLQEDLEKLKELDNTEDLNPRAVEDVALVLSISLNALKEFKKELDGDVE